MSISKWELELAAEADRSPLHDEIRHLNEQLEAADLRNAALAAENAVLKDRIEVKELDIREYERSMERANLEIRRLKKKLSDYKGDGYFDPEPEEA
jgi:chromosome segregation ATPase